MFDFVTTPEFISGVTLGATLTAFICGAIRINGGDWGEPEVLDDLPPHERRRNVGDDNSGNKLPPYLHKDYDVWKKDE